MEKFQSLATYLKLAKEAKDKEFEGKIRNQLGIYYHSIGKYDQAIENFEAYLTIAKENKDKRGKGQAYGNLGACYSILGQYDKAVRYLQIRLTIAKEIGDKKGEGAAYGNLGQCYNFLGQYDKAIEYLQIRLTVAKEIGDKRGEGAAYGNLGACYCSLGQYNKAIEYHQMCLANSKEIGDKTGEGKAYGNIGVCYIYLGQYGKAMEYQQMHLTISKEVGDKEGERSAYCNLGTCYKLLGQYEKAIMYNQMHLTIAKEIGNKECEGTAFCNLGVIYGDLGQYQKSIKYQKMHLTIAKDIGDKAGEGSAYGNLGVCCSSLGQYHKAIKFQEMQLNIAKEIGNTKDTGAAYCNLGTSYSYLGQYDKAIKYQQMYLNIAREIGDKKGEGEAWSNFAVCYGYLGEYDKAIKYQHMHLAIAKEIRHRKGEGTAYGNLGVFYRSLGQCGKAITYLKMHLIIEKEIGNKVGEATAYGNLGLCYISARQYHKAENNLRLSVQCCEELFQNVPKWDEDKISVIDTFIKIYKQLMQILLIQEKRYEALVAAEIGRSRALADLLLTTYPVQYSFVVTPMVSNLRNIRTLVQALGSTVLYFTLLDRIPKICTWVIQPNGDVMFHQSEKYHVKRDLLHSLNDFNSLVHKSIELMTSCEAVRCEDRSLSFLYPENVSKPAQSRPVSIQSVSTTLDKIVLQGPKSAVPHPVPMQEHKTKKTRAFVREGEIDFFSSPGKPGESMLNRLLKYMYKVLLKPVRQYVVGSHAIVVPEGALALAPFAALMDESGKYVAQSLQVRLIPSLSTAKIIRERPEEPAGQTRPLVIGDPDIGQVKKGGKVIPVPNLQFAKKEVEVVSQFLKVIPLVGIRATKKRFLNKVESASLIHIAAHGDAERGEILLAPSSGTGISNAEDIMLLISDLESKRIKAKLVVLSCCYSGCGKVKGEGVIGIARAFLGAGARAVLVTLWAVDDAATLCFMYRFYEYLTSGDSANEALNKAMNATREIKKFHHPRYWAPFVLLGEDVTPFSKIPSNAQ